MPETLDSFFTRRRPTADYPLLGQTILIVEDSRFASEALRLLCLRSGARIRRADSLRAAARHLATYRPTVAVVDLGLPDGSGLPLITELAEASPRIEVILASSGDDTARDVALAAGADGFLPKPLTSLAAFQSAVLAHLPPDARPPGPRAVQDDRINPDPLALRDDLAHAAEVAQRATDEATLNYLAKFLSGLARSAEDEPLMSAADAVARALDLGKDSKGTLSQLSMLVAERLAERDSV